MTFLEEHQLDLMLFLSGLCAALSLMVFVSDSIPPKRRKTLLLLELSSFILLIADRFAYIFRGDTSLAGYIMVRASNFIVFFMSLFVIFSFNLYLKNMITNDGEIKKVPVLLNAVGILFFSGTALLIISQFTGLYYYFDDQNFYHRNSGIAICYAIPLICLILQIIVIIRNRKLISRIIYPSILLFAIVPLIATIVQMFTYGLSLTNISIVGMALLIYFFSLKDMNEKLKKLNENEINILKDEQEHIQALFEQTAAALASAIDAKDKYTHGHSRRVAEYSRKIAEFVGKNPTECREIYYSALLHDVGKIGVPDTIINKEGKLTDEEFNAIKAHPTIGNQILSSISKSPYLSIGAHFHHERYDGNGYPQKLKGNDIPEIARIIAVADAYDAMTSKRSYRDPLPQQIVRDEIVKGMDTQFDPEYAKVMLHLIDLDLEYELREHEEVKGLSGKMELLCNEFRDEFSEGIQLTANEICLNLRSTAISYTVDAPVSLPAIVLFDSLDARVHYNDKRNAKSLNYSEYCEIRFDGEVKDFDIRKFTKKILSGQNLTAHEISELCKVGIDIEIKAVKYKDHMKITVKAGEYAFEVIAALPDSSRFVYLCFTGQNCRIDRFKAELTGNVAESDTIERIAPEISYIKGPIGNVPNLQIDGWRSEATMGEQLVDKMEISFHYMSLPTARLVWHCPFVVLFYSDNGRIDGENYREIALIRFDGESWDSEEKIHNNLLLSKEIDFVSWDHWRERNKQGEDCTVEILRKKNTIATCINAGGLSLKNLTDIDDETIDTIYVSLTGDQCALTNIWIKNSLYES